MTLEWLSTRDRKWVAQNGDLLNAVWAHFAATGEWPDPVEILRGLRAANPNRRVNAALAEMPKVLGQREYAPPRLVLSVFGLGCCPNANPLLCQYVAVAQLALRRFDLPSLPNRLTRADVMAELGPSEVEADRLSEVLMRDAPFLGSGTSGIDNWDREIDPRAEDFEGIDNPESLLIFLAVQRRIAEELDAQPEPQASPPEPAPDDVSALPQSQREDPRTLLAILAGLATIGSFVVNIVNSPSVPGLVVFTAFLGLTVILLLRRSGPGGPPVHR
jgi:hypothetical protein